MSYVTVYLLFGICVWSDIEINFYSKIYFCLVTATSWLLQTTIDFHQILTLEPVNIKYYPIKLNICILLI